MKLITIALVALTILGCNPERNSSVELKRPLVENYVAQMYPGWSTESITVYTTDCDVLIKKGDETKVLYLKCINGTGTCVSRFP